MVSDRDSGARAVVTAIQHFCLHDGPGTRSVVFFKGCPLRCPWCQNPETWRSDPQRFFKQAKCLGCGSCVKACPEGALLEAGQPEAKCRARFDCTRACPSGALSRVGDSYTIDGLLADLRPEFPLFRRSGGGVTLSGGEPTFAALPVAAALTKRLHDEGLHVALETCGSFALERVDGDLKSAAGELLAQVDLVLFDIKIFDPDEHKAICGAGNGRIRRNLELLAERARNGVLPELWPRLPLVPEMTDGSHNLRAWADFLKSLRLTSVTLVPYHRMGESKRAWLGYPPMSPQLATLSTASLDRARRIFAAAGIECFRPGEEIY